MKSAISLLLLAAVANAEVFHQPADGYYRCSSEQVCKVKGCSGDSCSVIAHGFDSTTAGDITTYVANVDDAELTVTGGDGTAVMCVGGCVCQAITKTIGCGPPKDAMGDVFPEEATSRDASVSQAQQESGAVSARQWLAGIALSAFILPAFYA